MSVVKVTVPRVDEPPLPEIQLVTPSMLEVATSRFGTLLIPAAEQYTMDGGMHGFPELREFVLLAPTTPGGHFYWWQSTEEPEIAFPCCDPAIFFPEYRIQSDEADVLRLKLADRPHLQVLVIVTAPRTPSAQITANLLGPLLMDPVARDAWQLICERSDLRVAAPLIPPVS
ncbi:MAG: flagellar assembly protein FliW [bacterium]